MHCTNIWGEFECGGHNALGAHPQKCGAGLRRWENQRRLSSRFCTWFTTALNGQITHCYWEWRHRDAKRKWSCCMHSTFLQTLLTFSSLEGYRRYRLQFSIPRAYFVHTVWHCTGQHCSSMYACTYRLFACTWRPLVNAIITLLCCDCFSSSSVVSRAFNARIRQNNVRASSSSYHCAKYCFFHSLHCW